MSLSLLRIAVPSDMWCRQLRRLVAPRRLSIGLLVPLSGDRFVEQVALGPDPDPDIAARVAAIPGVTAVDAYQGDGRLRVRFAGCPVATALREAGLVPRFPFQATAEEDIWMVDGQRRELDHALRLLGEAGLAATIEPVARGRTGGFTEHQESVLSDALRHGYYAVPRRISLTELARTRGVAKSTLSETMMLIEKKLAERYRELGL